MPAAAALAHKVVEILVVDDNSADVALMKLALRRCRFPIHFSVVYDGMAAMSFLRHQKPFTYTPDPDMILLDLKLPRKSGWEVLTEINNDHYLNNIPTMIVTGSANSEDEDRAYRLGADLYIVKPMNLSEFPILSKSVERILTEKFHLEE